MHGGQLSPLLSEPPCLRLPPPAVFARRFVLQQAAQNVLYTEVRYSPHILMKAASYGATAAADGGTSEAPADEQTPRAVPISGNEDVG